MPWADSPLRLIIHAADRAPAPLAFGMIVCINQIEVFHAEQYSGWPAGPQGAIRFQWPPQTFAFEILILESDEQRQPLGRDFRQNQLRQLIPEVVAGLKNVGEEIVVRLDGALGD